MTDQAQQLLAAARKVANDEHLTGSEHLAENDPKLIAASLEVAGNTKAILAGLYLDFRKPDSSLLRRIRNQIIDKIARVTRSTVERPLLTQQKFNEQVYQLLKVLIKENQELKSAIEKAKQ